MNCDARPARQLGGAPIIYNIDEKRPALERLERLLLVGMTSPTGAMTALDWSELKKRTYSGAGSPARFRSEVES